jgi:signal transduction histidine kinase
MLAHELRSPLAPIRNAVEILRRTEGDEKQRTAPPRLLDRQVGQMTRLVDDLLDVSRISRARSNYAGSRSSWLRSSQQRRGDRLSALRGKWFMN